MRLRTQVFADGSLQRNLEVQGWTEDGERPTEKGWLESSVGLRLAEPESWDHVERLPGALRAEGFFLSAEEVPPSLSHLTDTAVVTDRNVVHLERQDLAVLVRWVYRETYGDPFGPAEMEAALDGFLDLLAELLREDIRRELGSRVNLDGADRFLRESLRALALEAFTVAFETASTGREKERSALWSEVLARRGMTALEAGEDEDWWDLQLPAVFAWMRQAMAEALSTPDRAVSSDDLVPVLPGPDESWERLEELAADRWGSEKALEERSAPYLEALFGYYEGASDDAFRFEARLLVPGTLVTTNGTPAEEGILWVFRDEDISRGEAVMSAESVELVPSALRSLGARRSFSTLELLRLRDILVLRDEDGALVAGLREAVERSDLGSLLGEDGSASSASLVGELVELLAPGLLAGGE